MRIFSILIALFVLALAQSCCWINDGESPPASGPEPIATTQVILPEKPTETPTQVQVIGGITSIKTRVWISRSSDLWEIDQDEESDLQNNDGVKVTDGGKSYLKFPGPVVLLVYNTSEIEDITAAEVDPGASNKLIAGKLIRGGMFGYVEPGSELTINLAWGVNVKVLGTNFFIVCNEENGHIYIGKFDGTVIITAPISGQGYIPDAEMVEIFPDGNVTFSSILFSPQEFDEASTAYASPIEALNSLQEQHRIPTPTTEPIPTINILPPAPTAFGPGYDSLPPEHVDSCPVILNWSEVSAVNGIQYYHVFFENCDADWICTPGQDYKLTAISLDITDMFTAPIRSGLPYYRWVVYAVDNNNNYSLPSQWLYMKVLAFCG